MPSPDASRSANQAGDVGQRGHVRCRICREEVTSPPIYSFDCPIFHVIETGVAVTDEMFGKMALTQCPSCGHVFNAGFQDSRIEEIYTSQIPTNAPVHISMTESLRETVDFVAAHASTNDVLEIGGGSGDLARLLAEQSDHVTLIEPGLAKDFEKFAPSNLTVRREMFPEPDHKYSADLVILRQVLEHVSNPAEFLEAAITGLQNGGHCYVEVPRLEYIMNDGAAIDIHYMHVHYFHADVLEKMFDRLGLTPVSVRDVKDGHDVGYLLRKDHDASNTESIKSEKAISDTSDMAISRIQANLDAGRRTLEALAGESVALYGACAYSQSLTGLYADILSPVIAFDDTAEYNNNLIFWRGGTCSVRLPEPALLKTLDVVVITAYLHDRVIAKRLRDLGFDGKILSVRADGRSGKDDYPESIFA